MVKRVTTQLVDDLDGKTITEGGQTIDFTWGRTEYSIDLSDKNAEKLHKALQPYLNAARKGGRRGQPRDAGTGFDPKAVRRWAESNGIKVSPRGRVPADVVQQYRDAGY